MLDAASSDLVATAGSSTSIPPVATDMAAVTVAAPSSEANTHPHSSVNVDIAATTVTIAADVANDARYVPAINVNGSPSLAALYDDADDGGAESMSVQAAVVSVISNAAKSSLCIF